MEASIFSALSLNFRISKPSFFGNGNVVDIRELSSLACSCLNHVRIHHRLSLASPKQHNLVLDGSFEREIKIKVSPGCHCLNLRTGMFTPFRQASHQLFMKPFRVKSEDSEGTLSGESIIINEQTLEQELQTAIEEENYAQAAKIRDNLRLLQEDSKASVLAANARFYNSFRKGDLASMQGLWSKGDNVCVVHPGVSGISGYDLVLGSWEYVWADYEFPLKIEIEDVQVHVGGDVGYVTCTEMVKTKGSSRGKQFATNVFEKINGQWFICIHHASSFIDL
ncbi:unnamed protein product [Ilex paraguariensis]|uniref:F-box protein SKIP8 n=1 Tax=Ilex paraguariensis TaxID=185542 RepID=A0ABC8UFK3_9AQUA